DRYHAGLGGLTEELKKLPPYQWLKHRLSQEAKDAIKLRLRLAFGRDLPPQAGATASPVVTRDMWHLQTVRYPLPTNRFRATFGHPNSSAFAPGLASSLAWLHFIGFDQRSTAAEPARSRSPRVAFAEEPGAPADHQQ
ncbi:MAG TPA: hypothetical protein VMP00_13190, partial [Burkholderiales bacterium]|nr:hypothetical protein [Burkholderiales bacterium]